MNISLLPAVLRLENASILHLSFGWQTLSQCNLAIRLRRTVDGACSCLPPLTIRGKKARPVANLCQYLVNDPHSPLQRHTPEGANIDAVIDVRAIFQQPHRGLNLGAMPTLLLPKKGSLGLVDYEKTFCPDLKNGQNIFTMRGVDATSGAMVVVRPDQYIALVLPLDAVKETADFFASFMRVANQGR